MWAQAFGINTHTFNGRYITAYHGFDSSITGTVSEPNPPAVPFSVSGTLFSDGNGNVIGFENIDFGAPGTGAAAACDITGTYTVATAQKWNEGFGHAQPRAELRDLKRRAATLRDARGLL